MEIIKDIFDPLIGQYLWGARRGHGSFLMMEFGLPHLDIRPPMRMRGDEEDYIRKTLGHRMVLPAGQWKFSISAANWEITADKKQCDHEDRPEITDSVLRLLSGQKLVSVTLEGESLLLAFDIGASIKIYPEQDADREDDRWWLHDTMTGTCHTCLGSGEIESSAAYSCSPGMLYEYRDK